MKRRNFIASTFTAGIASASLGNIFGPFTTRAFANGPLLAQMAYQADSNRILVVLQLDGGNDGLNTIVPSQDPLYFTFRGDLAINNSIKINDTLGWHPSLAPFEKMYGDGNVAIVQNVGYPNPNLSHFRSTDIFFTASNNTIPADQNSYLDDGWLGRYLNWSHPGYPDVAPEHPMALQIGTTTALLLQGPTYGMGMAINDPDSFYNIISQTDISGAEKPDLNTPAGLELDYVQRISTEALAYAKPVRDTYNASQGNKVTFPSGVVSSQLKIISRLIGGGLNTPIYIISLRGFDTHSAQAGSHARLLSDLSGGIAAFFDDLQAFGQADRVALMTISEFGRRVQANIGDSGPGTDHGTAAPMLFVGQKVNGGVYGDNPKLDDLNRGNLKHEFDFKQTYASVLTQWFGVNPNSTSLILKGNWEQLALFEPAPLAVDGNGSPAGFVLEQNHPNPLSSESGVSATIRFQVPGGQTTLKVYNVQGKEVATLVNASLAPGMHNVSFNPSGLPSGTYVYRLFTHGMTQTRSMIVTK